MIYRICSEKEADQIRKDGVYCPESLETEGFIHFSKLEQVCGTAGRFYKDQTDLVILEVDEVPYGDKVVFENTSGGTELFPHLYTPLKAQNVVRIVTFPRNADGSFSLPLELRS